MGRSFCIHFTDEVTEPYRGSCDLLKVIALDARALKNESQEPSCPNPSWLTSLQFNLASTAIYSTSGTLKCPQGPMRNLDDCRAPGWGDKPDGDGENAKGTCSVSGGHGHPDFNRNPMEKASHFCQESRLECKMFPFLKVGNWLKFISLGTFGMSVSSSWADFMTQTGIETINLLESSSSTPKLGG